MLDNIKSLYIIAIIIDYKDEKRKLELIKYNKNLQKRLDISLLNYKFLSGRYIIYEEKEKAKGREYKGFDGKLLFEGEYYKGAKKKGIEYYDFYLHETLIFEVEYKNHKTWNGKLYLSRNIIYYEIKEGKIYLNEKFCDEKDLKLLLEYLDEYKNTIKEDYYSDNDDDGLSKYEGEYSKGYKHGKGKYYFCDKLIFEGEYLYDHRLRGKGYFDNGNIEYEGEYLYGKKYNGKGYDENGNLIYKLINGNGKVKEYKAQCLAFDGEYLNGLRNGKGKEYKDNNLIFEGEYLNGERRNGKGKEYDDNNLIFEGEYLNGKRWKGIGKEYLYDGESMKLIFEGKYLYGKRWNGKGKEYDDDGQLIFEGEYIDGLRNIKEF